MTRSPSQEAEMVISGNEFGFGEEHVKPLMEVCFSRESSGKDLRQVEALRASFFFANMKKDRKKGKRFHLISTVPSEKTSVRPTPEAP